MDWIPEPKPASGGLAAEGFYRLLGRPRLDPLTVLVRETAQNSWDARLGDDQPVVFALQGWELTQPQRKALRGDVFPNADAVNGSDLAVELASDRLSGLCISDRNTKGLGGPLRADQSSDDDVYDWVDFVLNVGEANTQGHTGGTYGFGKTIAYVVSKANAVVIHSHTIYRGELHSRLIACAIGERFSLKRKRYTGRHWWGVKRRGGSPEPVVGKAADRIAAKIGMPAFKGAETGANLLIVSPDFGGRTADQGMRFLAEAVIWNLWPKLTPRKGYRPMHISVRWEDEEIPVPRPEERPPLHGFAQAFEALLARESGAHVLSPGLVIEEIRCQRPKALAGLLSTVPLIHRERVHVDDGSDPENEEAPGPAAAVTGVCHHVALLRTPELVVDYREGPPPPEGGVEWAGVFRADDKQDANFAAAEPPTHDSWIPDLLPKSHGRTIVNVGLREIQTALTNRWAPRRGSRSLEVESTARIADELAPLLGNVPGSASGRRDGPSRPTLPGRSHPRVEMIHAEPVQYGEGIATSALFRVVPAKSSRATSVHVAVAAALDGRIGDLDLDPELELIDAVIDGKRIEVSAHEVSLLLDGRDEASLRLLVSRGADTTVLFDVKAESA